MDLTRFGYDRPLRASSLPYLVKCPLRAMLLYSDTYGDEGGKAAQTGSVIHEGVETFHKGRKESTCKRAMKLAASGPFPLADLDEAEKHWDAYARDPRNQTATIAKLEEEIEFQLDPPPGSDLPIRIQGRVDQIREIDGVWYLFDLKTGKVQGWDMIHEYAYQIAAYCVGATKTFGRDVQPGALIRSQGYFKRGQFDASMAPDGVFFHIPWDLNRCYELLEMVSHTVSNVRQGKIVAGPGPHCHWCPAGGLEGCLPELRVLT